MSSARQEELQIYSELKQMMFNKQELMEMFEKQVDAAQVWLETVNAQAITIKSQQETIRQLENRCAELKAICKEYRYKNLKLLKEKNQREMN